MGCAHKQMATDAAPLKALNEPGIPPLEKASLLTAVVRAEPASIGLKETPAASKTSSAVK